MQNKLILVINAGSSSLKFGLFRAADMTLICEGLADALNSDDAKLKIKHLDQTNKDGLTTKNFNTDTHADAIEQLVDYLSPLYDLTQNLLGIGHRVVHGGETFKCSTEIDQRVLDQINTCIPLAPLHNPANLEGIKLTTRHFPNVRQVAVFDTSFHQSMPPHAYIYALPYSLYSTHGIRRYGFHGSSHRYVARKAAKLLGKDSDKVNLISAHLGNGASICAIKNGLSVDTSMGMTPLEGLVMGTRSGDIDPGIFDFMIAKGYSPAQISKTLNKQSGLLGISEQSNDMRTLVELADEGDQQCALALDIFCFRLAKYIAAMLVSLPSLDALIFTGGIGENAAIVREKAIAHLSVINFHIVKEANNSADNEAGALISAEGSHKILVIATNEEKMIVEDTLNIVAKSL